MFLSYFKFLYKSTNQHGVHSPFVYQYLTKGIYQKSKQKKVSKSVDWLLRTLFYFSQKSIYCLSGSLKGSIAQLPNSIASTVNKADILILSNDIEGVDLLKGVLHEMNTEQLLLLVLNDYSDEILSGIRNDESVTLVLDFYYGVLISKRKEQRKQNFYLRM